MSDLKEASRKWGVDLVEEAVIEAKRLMSDPTFYVEARVGSANYRNAGGDNPCRAVYRAGSSNEPADLLILLLANAVVTLHGEQPREGGEG